MHRIPEAGWFLLQPNKKRFLTLFDFVLVALLPAAADTGVCYSWLPNARTALSCCCCASSARRPYVGGRMLEYSLQRKDARSGTPAFDCSSTLSCPTPPPSCTVGELQQKHKLALNLRRLDASTAACIAPRRLLFSDN